MKFQILLPITAIMALKAHGYEIDDYEDDHTLIYHDEIRSGLKSNQGNQFHGIRILNETIQVMDPSFDFMNVNNGTLAVNGTVPIGYPQQPGSEVNLENEEEEIAQDLEDLENLTGENTTPSDTTPTDTTPTDTTPTDTIPTETRRIAT